MDKDYGFDDRRGAVIQLRNLLNVSDAQFREIKGTIRTLVSTKLNIDFKARYQFNEFSGIEDELKTLFPSIFNSTQKLVFARKVIMLYHRQQRYYAGHTTSRATSSLEAEPPHNSRTQRSRPSQLTFHGKGTNSGRKIDEVGKGIEGTNKPSCPSFGDGQSTQLQASGTPSNTIPGPRSSHISHIHNFLQSCSPPLDHLFARFFDFGFQTPDILKDVAQKWTTEERRGLMKRIGPGPNGNIMTELELVAIEKGFQAIHST